MIRIAQDDARAQRLQFRRGDGFDAGLGAHRHIDGCGDVAVRSMDGSGAGRALRVARLDGEAKRWCGRAIWPLTGEVGWVGRKAHHSTGHYSTGAKSVK